MEDPTPGKQLLIASTGGHLAQLAKWAPRIGATQDSLWITFETPQSVSLLSGRRALYVPYVAPRDFIGTTKAFRELMREIDWRAEAFGSAISTGAALGLAGLAAARLHGIPSFYFESVSRVNGPSLTGRLVSLDPGIHRSCQYEHWAGHGWRYRGSLFDNYIAMQKASTLEPKLFVTLGTIRPYRFDALVDSVLTSGLANESTVWQVGVTTRSDLPGKVAAQLSQEEFRMCAKQADVVIAHSGVGSIMELLDLGVFPVVIPRRAKRGEHVDDHQLQVASVLDSRGLALVLDAEDLGKSQILEASSRAIAKQGNDY